MKVEGLAVAAVATGVLALVLLTPTNTGGGVSRRPSEDEMLAMADPRLRLPEVLALLRAEGFQPRVVFTHRTFAKQAELVQKGRSRVRFSFHNVLDYDGTPAAMAADLIDRRYGWGDNEHGSAKTNGARDFFLALRRIVRRLGLHSGGDWMKTGSFWDRYGLGWDPAHFQLLPSSQLSDVRSATLAIARRHGIDTSALA